jgi:hypothetical protein
MNAGKKFTIYLATGLPRGVREVKIDQWSGEAICGPRNALKDIIAMPEIESGACVYFLIGSADEGGLLDVYVGEADGFKERIKDHDYKKEWWQDVVVFVSQDKSLTKTGVQYLESVCIKRSKEIGRCGLKNGNNPTMPTVPREDVSGLEMFYENLAAIMPLLGYDIFVQTGRGADKNADTFPEFVCKKNDGKIVAHGSPLDGFAPLHCDAAPVPIARDRFAPVVRVFARRADHLFEKLVRRLSPPDPFFNAIAFPPVPAYCSSPNCVQ